MAEERVGHLGQIGIERNDAVAAGLVGKADDLAQQDRGAVIFVKKDADESVRRGEDGFQGELEHDRSEGSAEDDHGGGGLQHLAQMSAFEQQAGENAGQREENAAEAAQSMGPGLSSARGQEPCPRRESERGNGDGRQPRHKRAPDRQWRG